MTGASVGTSFPLGLTAPEGRERFVFCLKDVGLCQVQPRDITIRWLPDQDGEGRGWGIHSGTRVEVGGDWRDHPLRPKLLPP